MKFLAPIIFFIITMFGVFCGSIILIYLRISLSRVIPYLVPPNGPGLPELLVSLILFGILFFFINTLILKLERIKTPCLVDHLRQCIILYFFIVSGPFLGLLIYSNTDSRGAGLAFIFICICAYAIIVNGITLFLVNKRLVSVEVGIKQVIFIIILLGISMYIVIFDKDRVFPAPPKIHTFPASYPSLIIPFNPPTPASPPFF